MFNPAAPSRRSSTSAGTSPPRENDAEAGVYLENASSTKPGGFE